MHYLDSSALVKLVMAEAESHALAEYIAGHGIVTSSLARTETLRAVGRRDTRQLAAAIGMCERITLVAVSDSILKDAASIAPASIRSLDAIHVATALQLHETIGMFVSYDTRMASAATLVGLPVASPR